MPFKDFFDSAKSMSSMRLSMFIIVVTVCIGLIYLTFAFGLGAGDLLIWALGLGVTGKFVQKFAENKKPDASPIESVVDKPEEPNV